MTGDREKLTRRLLLAGTAALAASCATAPPSPPPPYPPPPPPPPPPPAPASRGPLRDKNQDERPLTPEKRHAREELFRKAHNHPADIADWRVSWPDDMEDAPDYAHAARWPIFRSGYERNRFTLTPAVLTRLVEANHFEISDSTVVFGLRGCVFQNPYDAGRTAAGEEGIRLVTTKPDHYHLKCVIGVWKRRPGPQQITLFNGSTVPAGYYMRDQALAAAWQKSRPSCGRLYSAISNLMPTGLYRYYVGTHGDSDENWTGCEIDELGLGGRLDSVPSIPGALRLKNEMTMLRTVSDLRYGLDDVWCIGNPWDNIHAARSATIAGFAGVEEEFSSGGCQVIFGDYDHGHTEQWRSFRSTAGLAGANDGKEYLYMLLTGHDAALAASDEDGMSSTGRFGLLRQGSVLNGAVQNLQRELNRRAGGTNHTPLTYNSGFGAKTAFALMRYREENWHVHGPVISRAFVERFAS